MTRLLATAACGLLAGAAQAQEAEVMHWWTSGSEAAALQVFTGAFEAAGGTWIDNAVPDFESAIAAATSSIIGGNPPDALQFNAGTQFADLAQLGYLGDLSGYAEAGNWQKALPPALYDAVSYDGKVYAMPVDNHGENWLWVNRKAMADAGVALPESWEGFFPMLDKLKAAGVIPVAHGGEAWQELELFYQIMMFRGDDALYRAIVVDGDTSALETPEFAAFAGDFRKLTDYVDAGAPGRKWNDATQMVISGQAAMQFMGDWAKGEFVAAGLVPGEDYDCVLGFGGEDRFVISADVFVLPEAAEDAAARDLLVATMMSPETQVAFNELKGGLPARLDADVSGMDACAQKGYAAMQTPEFQVPGPEISASADRVGAIQDAVTQYWNTPSETPADFAAALRDALEMTAE
ncbi:ABC transporter substrate-binding protein [Poseidonocella sp. HB161398]|uniref:ABC transporter substrate-binding protein n=1 Tax=Poseidonocella sp. HB161398 TaxID=2320855 RepID=UPI001108C899|nr:ABC transporter substrate-binding protein [Poseidonocella sp. HB161398]